MIEIRVRTGVNPYRFETQSLPAVPRRGDYIVLWNRDLALKVKAVVWHHDMPTVHINHRKLRRWLG